LKAQTSFGEDIKIDGYTSTKLRGKPKSLSRAGLRNRIWLIGFFEEQIVPRPRRAGFSMAAIILSLFSIGIESQKNEILNSKSQIAKGIKRPR